MEETSHRVSATSAGHALGEASYLDARFLAAQPEYEAMFRWAGLEAGWHVLDAGAGSGAYLPLLCEAAGAAGSVTLLDLAPENVAACQARRRALQPACHVAAEVGSLLSLPFGEASFDAVWCANTSQYLSDEALSTALAELKRVTRRGGLIAVKEADITCFQFAPIDPAMLWRCLEAARHTHPQLAGLWRAIELPRWFRQTGLVNVRSQTTLIARFGPLKPVEVAALRDLMEFTARTALNSTVSESDLRQWRQFLALAQDQRLFAQPDFFIREGAIVVVGEVA